MAMGADVGAWLDRIEHAVQGVVGTVVERQDLPAARVVTCKSRLAIDQLLVDRQLLVVAGFLRGRALGH